MRSDDLSTGRDAFVDPATVRIALVPDRWPSRVMVVSARPPVVHSTQPKDIDRGIELKTYSQGAAALLSVVLERPSLVIASTEMEGIDVLSFVEAIALWTEIPVVVGLAMGQGAEKIAYAALERGARSIIPMPFGVTELAATMRLVGATVRKEEELRIGRLTLQPLAYRLTVDGIPVPLTSREVDVVRLLMGAHPRVVGVEELADVLDGANGGSADNVRVLITRIRKKLVAARPHAGDLIHTVWGRGYGLSETVTDLPNGVSA